MTLKVAVSGIPRGLQDPRSDGNWLKVEQFERIKSISNGIEVVEIPADMVGSSESIEGVEVLLAEGGNRTHYPGELDWEDYHRFFTSSLRWVQLCSTGFSDNITPEIRSGDVKLTNAPGIHTIPIAESVIAAMLNHAKRLNQRRLDQERHLWRKLSAEELHGKVVLLLGLGNIGRRVAKLCKAFDMRVIGTKRNIELVENVDLVFKADRLGEYLPIADYLVIAAPLTPETENMIKDEEFKAMKSSAYLINVARGKITCERNLITALNEGWIDGAYLDCFTVEPLPEDHTLWDMDNVFIVPHDSHSSPNIGSRIMEIFIENLRRYINGEHLKHLCDVERGY
ncbi:MAG: D-2-hydroxyacid dehydrogenase [Candidatus Bathyarchaeia archaeon]